MKGIWTASSTANNPLASRTAVGACGERRQARNAAPAAGTPTDAPSHTPGSTQLESPSGSKSETGGVDVPVANWAAPANPAIASKPSPTTNKLRCGYATASLMTRLCTRQGTRSFSSSCWHSAGIAIAADVPVALISHAIPQVRPATESRLGRACRPRCANRGSPPPARGSKQHQRLPKSCPPASSHRLPRQE